ncbi:MAG TPA: hypothetical protein VGI57_02115, partial [Usitatibacter sp.]
MRRAFASLAAVVATIGASSALGQVLEQVVVFPTQWASVAVGQDLVVPQPQEIFYYSTSVTSDTIPLQVVGNCGTFAGATTVSVHMTGSGGMLYGNPPPFSATTVGECRLRMAVANVQAELIVDVYDPKTLQVVRASDDYPAVAKKASSTLVGARIVDAAGLHAGNQRVRYDPDPRHCALLNGA